MIVYAYKALETTLVGTTPEYTSPDLNRELATADDLVVQYRASSIIGAGGGVTVSLEEGATGAGTWLGPFTLVTKMTLTPGTDRVEFGDGAGLGAYPMLRIKAYLDLSTVSCSFELWVTGRVRKRRAFVSLWTPRSVSDPLVVAPDGYGSPARRVPAMDQNAGLGMTSAGFGPPGGGEIVTYGDERRVIRGLPPSASFRQELARLAAILAGSRAGAAIDAGVFDLLDNSGGETRPGGGYFSDWSGWGWDGTAFDPGDLVVPNTGMGSSDQRGQGTEWGGGDPSGRYGAVGSFPSRLDLVAEGPAQPHPRTRLDQFGPNEWREAFPPLPTERSNEPHEAPKPIITDDGLHIYGPQNPPPSAPEDVPKENVPKFPLKQPGPDGGGAGYAALAAWLLARISGLPIATWGAQSPSNVGPRVNPGRDAGSPVYQGPARPLRFPLADEPYLRGARRTGGPVVKRPLPSDAGWTPRGGGQ